jgi:hypothetical protein
LIAYTDFIGEALALKNICQDVFGRTVNLRVHQDNQSVLSILASGKLSGKSKHTSKHVRIRVAWIKERMDNGDFTTVYCPTDLMKSDGLTKPKSSSAHEDYREMIGVIVLPDDFTKERAKNIGTDMQRADELSDNHGSFPPSI